MNRDLLFTKSKNTRTREYQLKVVGDRYKTSKRKYFSMQHEINLWTSLPQEVVESIARSKKGLGKYMDNQSINTYFTEQPQMFPHTYLTK